jgi:hypothetical protein
MDAVTLCFMPKLEARSIMGEEAIAALAAAAAAEAEAATDENNVVVLGRSGAGVVVVGFGLGSVEPDSS